MPSVLDFPNKDIRSTGENRARNHPDIATAQKEAKNFRHLFRYH